MCPNGRGRQCLTWRGYSNHERAESGNRGRRPKRPSCGCWRAERRRGTGRSTSGREQSAAAASRPPARSCAAPVRPNPSTSRPSARRVRGLPRAAGARRGRGRHAAGRDVVFQLVDVGAHAGVGPDPLDERFGDFGPHPFARLLGSLPRERAGGALRRDRRDDRVPHLGDPRALERRARAAPARGRRDARHASSRRPCAGPGPRARRRPCSRPTRSASSTMPRFTPCSSSPAPGASSSVNTSTMPATATSDCPTPTVSTSTTSKPAASHTNNASRVRRATPPSVPPEGDGRMNAEAWRDSCSIRVLSPRIEPPLRVLDGSTASTATL